MLIQVLSEDYKFGRECLHFDLADPRLPARYTDNLLACY